MKTVIFLAEGFEMAEAVITIDILRRAEIVVDIASATEEMRVKAKDNLVVHCEKKFSEVSFQNYTTIILPGGDIGVDNLNKNQELKVQLVNFAKDKNKKVAAICAAPQILGQLGVLDNKKITFFPGCDTGLDKAIKTKESVVVSDNIITGKSVGCAFDFALRIVKELTDKKTSQDVVKRLEF